MSDHGIILKPEKVLAFLNGATQMRVPVDPQPEAWMVRGVNRVMNYRKSPFGVPGDVVWFREKATLKSAGLAGLTDFEIDYCADRQIQGFNGLSCRPYKPHKWTPSTQMPRWASRIVRTVTRVWVEEIHRISNADLVAEGIQDNNAPVTNPDDPWECFDSEVTKPFYKYWESLYGPEDMWCWAGEFVDTKEGGE